MYACSRRFAWQVFDEIKCEACRACLLSYSDKVTGRNVRGTLIPEKHQKERERGTVVRIGPRLPKSKDGQSNVMEITKGNQYEETFPSTHTHTHIYIHIGWISIHLPCKCPYRMYAVCSFFPSIVSLFLTNLYLHLVFFSL